MKSILLTTMSTHFGSFPVHGTSWFLSHCSRSSAKSGKGGVSWTFQEVSFIRPFGLLRSKVEVMTLAKTFITWSASAGNKSRELVCPDAVERSK